MKKFRLIMSMVMLIAMVFAMTSGMASALVVVDTPGELPEGSASAPEIVPETVTPESTPEAQDNSASESSCRHTDWSTPSYYQDSEGKWIAERYCLSCGKIQRSEGTAKEIIVKKPSCTEDGIKSFKAEFKADWAGTPEVHREVIPALGHSVDTSKFQWVGDENYHYNVCERCGEKSNPQPHEWGEWQVIKNADSQNPGKAIQYCTVCGCNRTCEIPRKTPNTADESMMGLWLGLAIISLGAACTIGCKKIKHN